MHVALLGDSTLDNRRYTNGGPAVVDQLEAILGDGHSVTLLAVDGDTTRQVPERLSRVPKEASHLVLSVGGNDALEYIDLLGRPAASVSEAITVVSVAVEQFDRNYRACLREVLALDRPTIVCSIYNGGFPEPLSNGSSPRPFASSMTRSCRQPPTPHAPSSISDASATIPMTTGIPSSRTPQVAERSRGRSARC